MAESFMNVPYLETSRRIDPLSNQPHNVSDFRHAAIGLSPPDNDNFQQPPEGDYNLEDQGLPMIKSLPDRSPRVHHRSEEVPASEKPLSNVQADAGPEAVPSTIMSLPPEMLANIFTFLDRQGKGRSAQVCRSWHDVIELKATWKDYTYLVMWSRKALDACCILARRGVHKIRLSHFFSNLMTDVHLKTLSVMPGLTHLTLSNFETVTNTNLQLIAQSFKQLVVLEVNGREWYSVTDDVVGYLCDGLTKLERLTLRVCTNYRGSITDVGMKRLATTGLPLRFLELEGFNLITDESLLHLSQGKPDLEGLELDRCPAITVTGIEHLATMKKLRYLMLSTGSQINHQLKIIAGMTSLRSLTLSACSDHFDDSGLQILASGGTKIKRLMLESCRKMTDLGVTHLAAMPSLRQLGIANSEKVTRSGLEHLLRRNRQLTYLDIHSCYSITGQVLQCIVDFEPDMQWLSLSEHVCGKKSLWRAALTLRRLAVLMVDGQNQLPKLRQNHNKGLV